MMAVDLDALAQARQHCRVLLYGEGPDNAMHYEWQPYLAYLLRSWQWGRLFQHLYWHARLHREIPLVGGVRGRLGKWRTRPDVEPPPSWIRPELLTLSTREVPRIIHAIHPVTYQGMTGPAWDSIFEGYDPGTTMDPIELLHPYMDVRIVQYLLRVPRIPWCRDKHLLRRAFQGELPEAVRQRPKTPLQCDPVSACMAATGFPPWIPEPELRRYVDTESVNAALRSTDKILALRAVSLNYFLAFSRTRHNT
jgi:asparagine synthase (glutamine-hydrolysing)